MLTQTELNKIYAEKLLETDSHDAAMLKVRWVIHQEIMKEIEEVKK
jgi:hypothetical protein